MYSSILSLIRTKEEIELLREEIRLLKDSLYKIEEGTFEDVLKNLVRVSVSGVILDAVNKSGIEKKSFLEGLEKALNDFSIITLTLAFEPRGKTIEVLSEWVKANIGENVALEFQYNPSIFAGVEVVFGGKFIDMSFKKIIEKELSEKFSEISPVLTQTTN